MKNYIVSSLMCFLVGCGSSSTSGVGGGTPTSGSEGSGGGTNAANAANEANPDFNKKVEGRKRITDEEFIKGYGENNAWFEASSGKDILDKIRSGHMPNEALLQGNETDAQKQLRQQMQDQFAYDKENNRAAKEERLSVVATTQNKDDLEAQELALVIKTKYPIVLSVGDQQSKWAKCHDETLGFQNMKNCLQECSQKIDKIKGVILTHQLSPTSQSAIDVNNLFDEFVITNSFLFDDRLKWVQKNEQRLQLLMSNKSLWKACDGGINCHDEKNSFPLEDGLYAKASWGHISKASEYTSKIFICGIKENWCSENKVASRLKVNPEETCNENIPYCKLLVRATGKEL